MSVSTCDLTHPLGQSQLSVINLGKLWLAFSYATPLAFWCIPMRQVIVSSNEWGPTTGKHINYIMITYKSHKQVAFGEFWNQLEDVLERMEFRQILNDPFKDT